MCVYTYRPASCTYGVTRVCNTRDVVHAEHVYPPLIAEQTNERDENGDDRGVARVYAESSGARSRGYAVLPLLCATTRYGDAVPSVSEPADFATIFFGPLGTTGRMFCQSASGRCRFQTFTVCYNISAGLLVSFRPTPKTLKAIAKKKKKSASQFRVLMVIA